MKKLLFILTLTAFVGSTTIATVSANNTVITKHDDKDKDKDKKKKKCSAAEKEACAKKAAAEGKSCGTSTEAKKCCASKSGAKAEAKPAEVK